MSNVMRDKFEIEDKKDSSPSYLALNVGCGCGQGLLSILATKVGAFINFSLAFLHIVVINNM